MLLVVRHSPLAQLTRSPGESSASASRRGEREAGSSTVLGDSARTLHKHSTAELIWLTTGEVGTFLS